MHSVCCALCPDVIDFRGTPVTHIYLDILPVKQIINMYELYAKAVSFSAGCASTAMMLTPL